MISCHDFRSSFAPSTEEVRLLEHVRSCDACLDFAARVDPDVMFRAIGGIDMIPPGGVDAFVDDVMREVRLRTAEESLVVRRPESWWRRLGVAAAVAVAITGTTVIYERETRNAPVIAVRQAPGPTPAAVNLTTKPVVETYDSAAATIVEVSSEESSNVKVVMIFDDNLPADL